MSIDYADVFPVLTEAVPEFKPSPGDLYDQLPYAYLNYMVRYVCDRAYPQLQECDKLLREFAVLMENLISDGDFDVHDLAHDALESVWARAEGEVVARYFGAETRELWGRICAEERGQ